jgi:hypothetical protein
MGERDPAGCCPEDFQQISLLKTKTDFEVETREEIALASTES